MSQHRIVSLIASATEIVDALGAQDQLVGRSHECDYPPAVLQLPACSEAKIDVNGTSRQIDDRVKSILRDATSVYRVFEEELNRLEPTVIITQTQCEVCAVSLKDVEQAVCQMVGSQPDLVALEPMCLADVWDDIERVGTALDIPGKAAALVAELKSGIESVAATVNRAQPDDTKLSAEVFAADPANLKRPTIACIEWIDPLMAAGNWIPELVQIAGGANLFGEAGRHSPWMTWQDLIERDPDVIAVMPCGWDIQRARREMSTLSDHPEWNELAAVKAGRVFLTDGNQYFNRPGPRLVESAQILAELLHPERVEPCLLGTGWEPYASAVEA
jgi:iron complex transport system substrate-binding protein